VLKVYSAIVKTFSIYNEMLVQQAKSEVNLSVSTQRYISGAQKCY